ncbi:hypothetical protein [Nonomuraea basaltis]|uniref:hypothetical protein n=1 Tax=Nonomuraea basaltis TaxID=2495887 RepID=UPI00110C4E02|nr:hypothetical protein [Nonomuraea basaltis]TMR90159.1 hypothetical protein EJK15_56790 [Nonomuraea basaltis]
MPSETIRVEQDFPGDAYVIPGRILAAPIAPDGFVTILDNGWHEDLSRERNRTAYDAIQAIEALGVRVIDVGHRIDGTSRISVSTPPRLGDMRGEILAVLRRFFELRDSVADASDAPR